MNIREDLQGYQSDLGIAFSRTKSFLPDKTPLNDVAAAIREMIASYLADAQTFHIRNDQVNEYASLAYAHGWFDAAIFLGYVKGKTPELYLPEDTEIPCDQQDRLVEKTTRYERMLREAVVSIEIAPESGSPLSKAAASILEKAEESCIRTEPDEPYQKIAYAGELGRFSYGYGWLDAGLRAGLFRICANPHLFTTETERAE